MLTVKFKGLTLVAIRYDKFVSCIRSVLEAIFYSEMETLPAESNASKEVPHQRNTIAAEHPDAVLRVCSYHITAYDQVVISFGNEDTVELLPLSLPTSPHDHQHSEHWRSSPSRSFTRYVLTWTSSLYPDSETPTPILGPS